MSLPEITLPYGLPPFLASDHGAAPKTPYVHIPMRTGHARKRRTSRSAPRLQSVALFLTSPQVLAFKTQYETTLKAGTEHFAAHVANQGPGLVWWDAQWVTPPRYEPLHGGLFRVMGQLLLVGDASATAPVSTTAMVEFRTELNVTATAVNDGVGAVEFSTSLSTAALGAVELGAALIHVVPSFITLQAGGYIRLQSGGRIQLQAA